MIRVPHPRCDRSRNATFRMEGYLDGYLRGITDQWLKVAPLANPGMLQMFHDRDRLPYRDLKAWSGELAGKYLTGAVQVLRLTGDPDLEHFLHEFVRELVSAQADDGYLGPWPRNARLTNMVQYPGRDDFNTWDTWGHYHTMLGLMLWHEETGDQSALDCVTRIADLLCSKYLGDRSPRLVHTGFTEMNLAPIHALALLHQKTGAQRYLDMARQICDEFAATDAEGKPLAGDYLQGPLAGKQFCELPKPRWESLHSIMGLVELYYITAQEEYRQAFERIWASTARHDRHNNGGFSSGEQATGNPYHQGAIETCCTIAWIALSVEMLRLTADPRVADELELSTINSVLGMHSHTGRWATYNTPMDGVRKASAHEIVFQAREGTPELNCCSVNSPRGFGMISDWALMQDEEGLILNWYGPGTMTAELPGGDAVTLRQDTDYPCSGSILLHVGTERPTEFTLKLRIPCWSQTTLVKVNGAVVPQVTPGRYLTLPRTWRPGDTVEISLDMSLHYWVGEKECATRTSIYRGPVLLTYDRRFNDMDPGDIPELQAENLAGRLLEVSGWIPPLLLVEFTTSDGRSVRLCDFGSAGEGGTPYLSWLPLARDDLDLPQYFATSAAP